MKWGHENIANFTAATWASGPSALQWRAAAERAGQQILLENPNLLISIGGLDYSSDLRELKNFPKLPKENLVYEAHSYSWQTSSKVVNVALPGSLPGTAPGQSSPGSWEAVRQTCTTLGEACGGVTCAGATDNCYVRRGNGFHEPLRGAVQADRHFSQINRFRMHQQCLAVIGWEMRDEQPFMEPVYIGKILATILKEQFLFWWFDLQVFYVFLTIPLPWIGAWHLTDHSVIPPATFQPPDSTHDTLRLEGHWMQFELKQEVACKFCRCNSGSQFCWRPWRTDRSNFATQTDAWWGFLVKENLVPVILTEFGMSQEPVWRVAKGKGCRIDSSHFDHGPPKSSSQSNYHYRFHCLLLRAY